MVLKMVHGTLWWSSMALRYAKKPSNLLANEDCLVAVCVLGAREERERVLVLVLITLRVAVR